MKRSLRVLSAAVAVLAALCSCAWAAGPTRVTSDTKDWKTADSPYYVEGSVTISDRITVTGTVELELRDGCTLNAAKGITVNASGGNKLTINGGPAGTGKLIATGESANAYAAIGGQSTQAGTIIINGGTVEATSQHVHAAAIGSVWNIGGVIEINGGTVTARAYDNAENYAAAIGGGGSLNKGSSDSGKITITDGIVTAIAEKGYGAAIGCGGGEKNPSKTVSSDITITGGIVTASAFGGAAIGGAGCKDESAQYFLGGTIKITGGVISAESVSGDGIGNGVKSNSTDRGKLVSDADGTAWIVAKTQSSLKKGIGANTTGFLSGVAFDGDAGFVFGDVKISGDVEIPSGATFVISPDKSLTIPKGLSMTMGDGSTLTIEQSATLTIEADATFDAEKGTVDKRGTIVNEGLVKLAGGTDIAALGMTGDGSVEMGGKTYDNKGNQTGGGGGDEPAKKDDTPVSVDKYISTDKLPKLPDSGKINLEGTSESITSPDAVIEAAPTLAGAIVQDAASNATPYGAAVTVSADVAVSLATEVLVESGVIAPGSSITADSITRMPIKRVDVTTVSPDAVIIFADLSFDDLVSSDRTARVEDIIVIKVKSADLPEPVDAATAPNGAGFENGCFMITDASGTAQSTIAPNGGPYDLLVRVTDLTSDARLADSENFDVDPTQGTVVDPIIVVKDVNGGGISSRSSSGGACTAGAAAFVAIAALALMKRRAR